MRTWALCVLGLVIRVATQVQIQTPDNIEFWHVENEDTPKIKWETKWTVESEHSELEIEEEHDENQFADKTIYEVLQAVPRFSRIFKAIKFDDATAKLFNDSSSNVTFFAPDNDAIPSRPNRRKSFIPHDFSMSSIIDDLEVSADAFMEETDDKKEMIRRLVHAILSYHVLPTGLDGRGLGQQSTHATMLKAHDGSIGGSARRISVIPPIFNRVGGVVNLYAKIKRLNIRASNGVIHVISFPLIPPLSVLESTFLGPDAFSVWTSSLQKVNISDATEYRVLPQVIGVANITSAPAVTTFIPLNSAWRHLPKSLQLFLFSPFGERALRKLLQLHIVPDFVLHADWAYNASSSTNSAGHECAIFPTPISADHVNINLWNEPAFMNVNHANLAEDGSYHVIGHDTFAPHRRGCHSGRSHRQGPSVLSELLDFKEHGPPKMSGPPTPPKYPEVPKRPKMPSPPKPPKMPSPPAPPKAPKAPKMPAPPERPHPHPLPKRPHPPHHKPKLTMNDTFVLPTLLTNHSITVQITRIESKFIPPALTTRIVANGVPIALADGVARNGAVHVVSKLLHPFPRRHAPHHRPHAGDDESDPMRVQVDGEDGNEEDESWEDWRDWLPQWAAED